MALAVASVTIDGSGCAQKRTSGSTCLEALAQNPGARSSQRQRGDGPANPWLPQRRQQTPVRVLVQAEV